MEKWIAATITFMLLFQFSVCDYMNIRDLRNKFEAKYGFAAEELGYARLQSSSKNKIKCFNNTIAITDQNQSPEFNDVMSNYAQKLCTEKFHQQNSVYSQYRMKRGLPLLVPVIVLGVIVLGMGIGMTIYIIRNENRLDKMAEIHEKSAQADQIVIRQMNNSIKFLSSNFKSELDHLFIHWQLTGRYSDAVFSVDELWRTMKLDKSLHSYERNHMKMNMKQCDGNSVTISVCYPVNEDRLYGNLFRVEHLGGFINTPTTSLYRHQQNPPYMFIDRANSSNSYLLSSCSFEDRSFTCEFDENSIHISNETMSKLPFKTYVADSDFVHVRNMIASDLVATHLKNATKYDRDDTEIDVELMSPITLVQSFTDEKIIIGNTTIEGKGERSVLLVLSEEKVPNILAADLEELASIYGEKNEMVIELRKLMDEGLWAACKRFIKEQIIYLLIGILGIIVTIFILYCLYKNLCSNKKEKTIIMANAIEPPKHFHM